MILNNDKATSRPLGVAKGLVNRPIDEEMVYAKKVVLTGEREILATRNGRWCFIDALILLSRVVGDLTVVLPDGFGEFEAEVRAFCARAWSRGEIRLIHHASPLSLEASDAVLSIGTMARPNCAWTVINSNGWVARVSSGVSGLPADVALPNPIGALMAASLGVSEVFKRIFGVPPDVAPMLEKIEFSLFEQTSSPTWIGPALPETIHLPDTLLVGAGAIGNGIAWLFSQLSVRGRVHIVDKQEFGDENLGTCILLELAGWLGEPKAQRVAAWLRENSNLTVTGEKALIESARSGASVSSLSIDLVLNGLDDVQARRDAQGLWPAVIVDGGINAIGAAVIQHRFDIADMACLMCWFEAPKIDERQLQSQWTGLSAESLIDTGRLLTEDDIARAAESKREWLRAQARAGKTVCSVITEAALARSLGVDVEEGFRPSVPFVATASAAMVVAEAVKALAFPEEPVVSMFQMASVFLGPEESYVKVLRHPSPSCQCIVHRNTINAIGARRRQAAPKVARP